MRSNKLDPGEKACSVQEFKSTSEHSAVLRRFELYHLRSHFFRICCEQFRAQQYSREYCRVYTSIV